MESAKRTSSPPIKKQKTESEVQQDTTKSPGIYTQLPQHILGKTLPSTDGAEYVNSVIRQATSSKHSNDNKQLIYMNNISKPKTSEDELKEHEQRIQSRKSIRSKEKRLKKLFMIPEDKRAYCNHNPLTHVTSYSMYLPLHNLWNQYISDIVGDLFRYSTAEGKYLPTSSGPLVEARMLKADLHGCILKGKKLLFCTNLLLSHEIQMRQFGGTRRNNGQRDRKHVHYRNSR